MEQAALGQRSLQWLPASGGPAQDPETGVHITGEDQPAQLVERHAPDLGRVGECVAPRRLDRLLACRRHEVGHLRRCGRIADIDDADTIRVPGGNDGAAHQERVVDHVVARARVAGTGGIGGSKGPDLSWSSQVRVVEDAQIAESRNDAGARLTEILVGREQQLARAVVARPVGVAILVSRIYGPAAECGVRRIAHVQIGRAQLAGATGVIVFNSAAGGEGLVLMGGENPVMLPDGTVVTITISGIFVQRSTGMLLRNGTPPVTARAEARFNGWGFLRIFDIKDPGHTVQVGGFATPNANSPDVATGDLQRPQPGGAWEHDLRLLVQRRPAHHRHLAAVGPREIGSWTGAPDEAPRVNLWGVALLGDLILVSDRNFGLYVLKQVP